MPSCSDVKAVAQVWPSSAVALAVAAIFIAQAIGFELSLADQAVVALTATLAAIGAAPHLVRPDFPVARGQFPADVDFHLAPFNPQTLDHFVFLERPEGKSRKSQFH